MIEGAYGTGKSHAALTIKSMLSAPDHEIRKYFDGFGLDRDLAEKLITDRAAGNLITVHRIGSASINSDQDLILAVQDSINAALLEHGIENKGEASLKEAAIAFLSYDVNRDWFEKVIKDPKYAFDFGGKTADVIIAELKKSEDRELVAATMRKILKVANDNGIMPLRMDIPKMAEWIKGVLKENGISILFVWDEFTEYFSNNPNSLTGFQTLAEISQSHPFYFLIVTHEGEALIQNKDMRKKILNRFLGDKTVRLELPDNMAFKLMRQAMKITEDPVLKADWEKYRGELNQKLASVRATIIADSKKNAGGKKTYLTDEDLENILPIHPYAALLLKHMAVTFNSNARSMFDFIISNDMTDSKGFKWYIENYGTLDNAPLLTIDMLWDFFNGKNQSGLNDEVRGILDSYKFIKEGALTPDEQRVFKTILLLSAVSSRVTNVDLLRPNEQHIDLAFSGTDWQKGKALYVAGRIAEKGYIFPKPAAAGELKEYMIANKNADFSRINDIKNELLLSSKTSDLIVKGNLASAISLPASIDKRYIRHSATKADFRQTQSRQNESVPDNRFGVIVTFAKNDSEAQELKSRILEAVSRKQNNLFYIETLTPLGEDRFERYIDNMAHARSYLRSDKELSRSYSERADSVLSSWRGDIENGAFTLYTPDNINGVYMPTQDALIEKLNGINRQKYPAGLEQYNLIDNMYNFNATAQGAMGGIEQKTAGTFNTSTKTRSIENALSGAWQIPDYWKDPSKSSLIISRIKNKAEEVIAQGFASPQGRAGIMDILDALENEPFGLMPNNITAFILGFILKEYVDSDYFWSNGSASEKMTADKMKSMIANALKRMNNPSPKDKDEYIVAMSGTQRRFLELTSAVFNIPKEYCGSIESARDRLRIAMKGKYFPIWSVKYALSKVSLKTPKEEIEKVIDYYCQIANTGNGAKTTESDLADKIGKIALKYESLEQDLKTLLTDDMCKRGMAEYIKVFRGGELYRLSEEIGDFGAYLEQIKEKFSADAANWVWSKETADDKINDVILDFRIIAETNKMLPASKSLSEAIQKWIDRTNNIKLSYEAMKPYIDGFGEIASQLYEVSREKHLRENNKQKFLDALAGEGDLFNRFYSDQYAYFIKTNAAFLKDLEEEYYSDFFSVVSAGQYAKSQTEYFQYIEQELAGYKKGIKKNRLYELWRDKTGTNDPKDWSEKYLTPVLCLVDGGEFDDAKRSFDVMIQKTSSEADVTRALEYLENARFYDRLNNKEERDKLFAKKIIGNYSALLTDVDKVRRNLREHIPSDPYNWLWHPKVAEIVKNLAEQQYKVKGYEEVKSIINEMGAEELKRYLSDMVSENMTVGIEILNGR